MILRTIGRMIILATAALSLSHELAAQGGAAGGPAAGAASITASSGTYSIESEILAYKALQANSYEIASEVVALRGTFTEKGIPALGRNLILVPSSSTAVPAFQLWRSHMVIVGNFLKQSQNLLQGGNGGCPIARQPGGAPPSFAGYTTAIGEGVTALQGILSLFSNSQSVNEFTGTLTDQALILAVARELRKSGVMVLTPDIYGPSTIAGIEPENYPFIRILGVLIDQHSALQRAYVCNAVAATAAGQIQQAEIARETDYAKLAQLRKGDDAKVQPLLDDIAAQTGILALVRSKIGLSQADLNTISTNEQGIVTQGRIVAGLGASGRDAALQAIHNFDVTSSNLEMPAITQINLKVAQIMSLVTGIESYLAGLTGGSITLTPPTAPSAPSGSATPSTQGASQPGGAQQATGGTGNGNGTGQGTTPATTPSQSSQSSASSTPTIVAVLQADGLAARMGLHLADDYSLPSEELDAWEIVWLKALESGGSIINEATILGSHPYFGGGAVSGYALYQLNGDLVCSANVASYGGYVKAKKFPEFASADHTIHAVTIGGNCVLGKP